MILVVGSFFTCTGTQSAPEGGASSLQPVPPRQAQNGEDLLWAVPEGGGFLAGAPSAVVEGGGFLAGAPSAVVVGGLAETIRMAAGLV